jgi:hypothetical protein
LDNVEVDPTLAAKLQDKEKVKEVDFQDLSSDDIGKIKIRIASMLEPGETVCEYIFNSSLAYLQIAFIWQLALSLHILFTLVTYCEFVISRNM